MAYSDEITQAVHRVQGGDVDAFALVVRAHQDEVRAFLAMLGVPSGDIEDVAQDAFVDAFTAIESYDCQQEFLPWLCGIARHRAQRFFRKRSRQKTCPLSDWTDTLVAAAESELDLIP